MYRIAVVGDRDSIYGFAALGLEVFPAENVDEANLLVRRLIKDDVAVIYLTESFAEKIYDDLIPMVSDKMISIVPIPSLTGNTGFGMKNLRASVEKAVGVDILFSDNK